MPRHVLHDKNDGIEGLALFGADPAFTEPLHVGRPNIGNRADLLARINDLLDRRWLTNNGEFVQEFENKMARRLGVRHSVATCNGTVALELLFEALGLQGEVIVPAFTFVATVHAVRWRGLIPVFCDVDASSHHLDPVEVRRLISPRTSAILGVHLWGRACDVDALAEIASERNLELLFDSAHALDCTYHGRRIGGFGHAEVFSFHATKVLNSFEGGAVTTDDDGLAERLRLLRNFGFADLDTVVALGTNGKMTEAAAAMGLTSLESLDAFIAVNRRHYKQYQAALADIAGLTLIQFDTNESSNFHYIVIEVDEERTGVSRDALLKVLVAENILARRYFYPGCHRLEPYRSEHPDAAVRLPRTEKLTQSVLVLPTGTALDSHAIEAVCRCLRIAVENGPEITRRICATGGLTR